MTYLAVWLLEGFILQWLPPAGLFSRDFAGVAVPIDDQRAAAGATAVRLGWCLVTQRLVWPFAVVEGEILGQPHGQLAHAGVPLQVHVLVA